MLVEDLEQYIDDDDEEDEDEDGDEDEDDDEEMKGGARFREIEIREQDRFLPVANIARIMKKVLPNNAKMAKDSKESIQTCVSEFISFITSEASEKCQQEKRKTINGDDILWAMATLGFESYIEPLRVYLSKYRDTVKADKPEKVERKPQERVKKEKKTDGDRASKLDSTPSSSSAASSSTPLVPSMMHIIDPQSMTLPIGMMPYVSLASGTQISPLGAHLGQDSMQLPSVSTLTASSISNYRPIDGSSGLLGAGESILPPLSSRLGASPQFSLTRMLSPSLPSPAQFGLPLHMQPLPPPRAAEKSAAGGQETLGIAGISASKMKKQRTEI